MLLVQPAKSLSVIDAAVVTRIEQDEQAAAVAQLARRFTAMVRACGIAGQRNGRAPTDPVAKLGWPMPSHAVLPPWQLSMPGWKRTAQVCAPS
ncbi:MAG: hypothetical protein ACRYG8_11505 [Janthinobacterium lividum]